MSDDSGNWPNWLKKAANWVNKNIVTPIKGTVNKVKTTFGAGVVQARQYAAFQLDTILGGEEHGQKSSFVIAGTVDKPVSVYVQNASDWWKVTEYKVGVQVNVNNGGASYSAGLGETSFTVAVKNQSLEIISGINKIGYTVSSGVDFGNLTSENYYHQYIRTLPAAMAFATAAIAAYYSGGKALIPLFGRR